MPKVNQLPFISSGTTATSFLVVDERATRRLLYDDFVNAVLADLGEVVFTGPTGPAGPKGPTGPSGVSSTPGPTGPSGPGLPAGGSVGQALIKNSNLNYDYGWGTVSGNGGIGLGTRTIITGTTVTLTSGNTGTVNVSGYKTYVLSKVQTSHPAWVRIYSDGTSRTNDATRLEGYDPLPGSGVIAEVITTSGNLTQLITPGVVGFNNDVVTTSTVYMNVTNKSGLTAAVSVTLSLLQLES